MKIVNTELLRPANIIAIALIVVVSQWAIYHLFQRHVVDSRQHARVSG